MADASTHAIMAVLGHKDDKKQEYVFGYESRGLKSHEKHYAIIELEALAILFVVDKFRTYIYGNEVIVLTDHSPLQWLWKHRDGASRLIGWALRLQQYNLKNFYRKGKLNKNADALSRIPQSEEELHDR